MKLHFLFKNNIKHYFQKYLGFTLVYAVMAIFIYGLVIGNYYSTSNFSICIFKNLLGFPCPGCGLTHASIAFWQGNWQMAFQYHVLAIPLNMAFGIWCINFAIAYLFHINIFQKFLKKIPNILLVVLAIVIFAASYSFQLYKFIKL